MSARLERNKTTVAAFHDLMFNRCRPAEAVERYAGDVYIQHNPHVAEDEAHSEGLIKRGSLLVLSGFGAGLAWVPLWFAGSAGCLFFVLD
jgi:hypothetical protein